ncbi:hypothetical protein I317_00873 [Kwoniella heveanensis CBS 569]|uniref:DUF1766-domain-containing protein n=1 Tax=Kwoniella heveanensis BCC8398 TaxID=1296120 RepID=A0A1B9GP58_9TREE|nr:hypothetical protein I316_05437 [Kwoniella heveanensis BCC8398]OCF45350.1 hypothetical protein I317_00873 [Kwoniella heveanensis CBS 569]
MRSALSSSFGAGPSRTPLTPLDASNTANSVEAGCSGEHTYRHEVQILPVEPESESERKSAAILQQASYPAKSFRPSVHPHSKPRLSDEARLRPPEPHTPPRPHSDPVVPVSEPTFKSNPQAKVKDRIRNRGRKGKEKATAGSPKRRQGRNGDDSEYRPIIDLTQLSSSESEQGVPSSDSSDDVSSQQVTSRSRIRHQRAVSEQPLRPTKSKSTPSLDRLSRMTITPDKTGLPNVNTGGTAVQCAGFTRTGQPCKRLVKTSAPYLVSHHGDSGSAMREEEGDQRSDRVMGRYCKDHAGMICQVGGFYWRGQQGNAGIWIDFADYIPTSLGQQTQALLRMTMESKLTDKECPGYLYAYELRDLETPTLTFFKVGRTDNVPRRIGQWTNQCQSKTPTLRDIFPLPTSASTSSAAAATLTATSSRTTPIKYTTTHHGKAPLMTAAQHPLHRSGTLTTSFLPGATTHLNPPSVAMKRWERLVHIELSDRCASDPESGRAFDRVREKCRDCGMGHKEIFPLRKASTRTTGTGAGAGANARAGTGVYEDVVVEIICRWERFILAIAA